MAKKIEISDSEVEKAIKSNKKFKRNSYWIFPIWFFISIVIISNEFYWVGWISLIISSFYFLAATLGSPTKFDEVKKDLIKKEKDRLDEIDKEKKEVESKAISEKKEAEAKAIREKKEKERLKLLKEKEKKINAELLKSNERVYFSHSFVSEKSKLYLINSPSNQIIESSSTNALKLYSEGFRIIDIDKTGQSAQLDSFNFVIRFSKQ